MDSNITKQFKNKARMGLRMERGGILQQEPRNPFAAPGTSATGRMATSILAQAQPEDAVAGLSSLSNTERSKLANPMGDAYGMDGKLKGMVSAAPGSSAEMSMMTQQAGLRQNMHDASSMSRLGRVGTALGDTTGEDMYRSSLTSGRGNQARFGLGLARGGIVKPVVGEGTGTSDDVPIVAAGHKVNVSNGEGVAVLPAKTMQNPTAVAAVEDIIEGSNDGKPVNKGLRDGMGAYTGVIGDNINPDKLRPEFRSLNQTPAMAQASPGVQNLQNANAERAAARTATGYKAAINTGSANDALRAAGKLPGGPPGYVAPPAAAAQPVSATSPANATSLREGLKTLGAGFKPVANAAAKVLTSPLAGGFAYLSAANSEIDDDHRKLAPGEGGVNLRSLFDPAEREKMGEAVQNINARDRGVIPKDSKEGASIRAANEKILGARSVQTSAPTPVAPRADGGSYEGLSNLAQRQITDRGGERLQTIAGDAGVRNTLNAAHEALGDGFKYGTTTTPDGRTQTEITGTAPTKMQYTAEDGTATNDWYKTKAFREGTERAAQDKVTLREMERDRYGRDMGSDIKDPRAIATGGLRLAQMNKEDEIDAKANDRALSRDIALQGLRRGYANDQRSQANADRTYEAGRDDKFKSRVDKLLESHASGEDGKLDPAKYAALQNYAAQIPRERVRDAKTGKEREMDDTEYLAYLTDSFSLDATLGGQGTSYLTPEKNWQGERAVYTKGRAGMDSLLRGAPFQKTEYRDPVSKRVVYQSDIDKLSPQQQAAFYARNQ